MKKVIKNKNLVKNSNQPQQESKQLINNLKPNKMKTTKIKINQVEQFKNYLYERTSLLNEERKSIQGDIDDRLAILNQNVCLDDEDISRIEEEIDSIEKEFDSIDNMIGVIEDLESKIDSTINEFNENEWVF